MDAEEDLANDDEEGIGMARHQFHRSEKILGRLFRAVDEKKIWDENVRINCDPEAGSVWEKLMGLLFVELMTHKPGLDSTRFCDKSCWIRQQYVLGIWFCGHSQMPFC